MRRLNRKQINNNSKKRIKTRKGKSLIKKIMAKKRWVSRKKTFSPYPYIITISYYKTNVFFTAADIKGHTRALTSTGRSGFKNKDKTAYMAVVRVMELFLKKIRTLNISRIILQFRNFHKRQTRFAVRFSLRKVRRRYRFHYIAMVLQNQMAFNGCRKKKKRRE